MRISMLIVLCTAALVVGGRVPKPAAPVPLSDLLVWLADDARDGGGMSIGLHMPTLDGLDATLYNASLGGDVFRVLFDAVELVERHMLLVYGARLERQGCVLEVREYSLHDGALQRVLYSAHDPTPDRRHCVPQTFLSSPAQSPYDTRHQWLCAVETSNRVTLFNPASRQVMALRISDGEMVGAPHGSLGGHLLDTLDLALHCSSEAADTANNRRVYVALRAQDLVMALDETFTLVASTTAVQRPRWMQVGAHWLYVMSSTPMPEFALLDAQTLASGASLTMPPLPAAVGSWWFDEAASRLTLMMPCAGAVQTYDLFAGDGGDHQSAALAYHGQRLAGIMLTSGSIVGGAGGELLQFVSASGNAAIKWTPTPMERGSTLARECNIQPQHATAIVPVVGRRCTTPRVDTPAMVVVDNDGYSVYHAGTQTLAIHAHHTQASGLRWLDAVPRADSAETAAALGCPTSGSDGSSNSDGEDASAMWMGALDVVAWDQAGGVLVTFVAPLDAGQGAAVAPALDVVAEDAGPIADAVLTTTSPQFALCYAIGQVVMCLPRQQGDAQSVWHVPTGGRATVQALAWDAAQSRLLATCTDGTLHMADPTLTASVATSPLVPPASVANVTHHVQRDPTTGAIVLTPCLRRFGPADANVCAGARQIAYTFDDIYGRSAPTYSVEEFFKATAANEAAASCQVLNTTWIAARHAEDGLDERRHKDKPNVFFIVFTCIVVCCLCLCAIIPAAVLARNSIRQCREQRARKNTGITTRAKSSTSRCMPKDAKCLAGVEFVIYAATHGCLGTCCCLCPGMRQRLMDRLEEHVEKRQKRRADGNSGRFSALSDDADDELVDPDIDIRENTTELSLSQSPSSLLSTAPSLSGPDDDLPRAGNGFDNVPVTLGGDE